MADSITYMRDEQGSYGFKCNCGHEYIAPSSTVQNPIHRSNLVDCMVRYHEAKHKKKHKRLAK